MKYAAVILFNNQNSLAAVSYTAVTDALLAGGVFLDRVEFLPYDAPAAVTAALLRLSSECDGVILVCDRVLLSSARDAVSQAAGEAFSEEYILETQNCLFAVLPTGERGAEIVRTETVPRIDKRRGNSYYREVMCMVGAPPEALRESMKFAREVAQGKLSIHYSEQYGLGRLEIIYDRQTPKVIADEVVRILASALKDHIYSMRDEGIASRLVEVLKLHRLRISTAESFTGGGVGREISRVPGASKVYFEGLNTYDRGSKMLRTGVSEDTLFKYGAVSDETAYEMALGLLKQGNCDVAIATTGVAGPDPDGDRPVGLCYIAVGTREQVRVYRYQLPGDRETISETAIRLALFLAYREIK